MQRLVEFDRFGKLPSASDLTDKGDVVILGAEFITVGGGNWTVIEVEVPYHVTPLKYVVWSYTIGNTLREAAAAQAFPLLAEFGWDSKTKKLVVK